MMDAHETRRLRSLWPMTAMYASARSRRPGRPESLSEETTA